MNHPRTTQQVDIGRCLFRASDSHLQLQFATTARLSQPGGHRSTVPPVKVSQWQDLSSVWVTEAPELDIRLFIRVAPGLDHAASVLVADLGGKLCISPIWSDLGFAVRLKSSNIAGGIDTPVAHCLTMGLYREHRQNNVAKGRTLPAVLQKPPDAHAPLDFPPITLVSIDIHLEYNYPPQSEEKFCDLLAYNIDSITEFGQWHYPPKIEAFEVATLTVSAHVPGSAYSDHRPYDLTASSPVHLMQDTEDNISSSRTFLELLDLGLQRLITSANSRRPQIRTIGKDTLQSLSRLFPAIFNPGYCEAMNQRAVSIPIISKALTSMLGKSNNPILRDKIFLLRDPNHQNFSTEDTDSSHPQPTILQPSIHSSLWRIAQDRVRRPNTSKRGTSFFATDPDPRQLALNEEFQSLEPPAEDEFDDIELLDGDQYDGIGHDIGTGYVSETPDEPPHDGDTDFFFEDSSASTQITMDDISPPYESTQITWDEFSSICDHIPLDYSDAEMLL